MIRQKINSAERIPMETIFQIIWTRTIDSKAPQQVAITAEIWIGERTNKLRYVLVGKKQQKKI
jgi:hypothetical protein